MLAKITNYLQNKSFLKNVLIMASGTVAGQAVMMLALPFVTRIYDPAAFGLLAIYMSLVAFIVVGICGRLEIAIPLPKSDADAINLVALALSLTTGLSVLLALYVIIWPANAAGLIGQPNFQPYLWMIPLGGWLGGIYATFQMWSVRRKRFADVAKTQFVRAVGSSGTQIAIGLTNPTPFGLIFGHFLYMGLGSGRLAASLLRHEWAMLKNVTLAEMRSNLSQQRRFPLLSVPESMLNSASVNLPILMIGGILGPTTAGFMLLGQRIGSIPVALLGSNISRVYLAQATEKRETGELGRLTRTIMWTLFKLAVVPFLALAISAPVLFPIVFGPEWARAGVMVTYLVPAMLMQFIVAPVSTILHATGNQMCAFGLQLSGFILMIGGIWWASLSATQWVFEVFAIASFIHYGIYLALIIYISIIQDQKAAV